MRSKRTTAAPRTSPKLQARREAAQRRKEERQAKRQARRQAAQRRKDERQAKRQAKLQAAQQRREEAQRKRVASSLRRAERLAARSTIFPSSSWEARFWLAVKELHPSLAWDNASREEVWSAIVPLWRVHRWPPEAAAQAICLRCEVPTSDPPQGGPVASGGRALRDPIPAPRGLRRASVLRPAPRPELRDLPRRGSSGAAPRRPPCSPDKPECSYSVTGGACTISAPLMVPARKGGIGAERIAARFCLVEIGQLRTSHQPLAGFAPRPDYPPAAQERDYRLVTEQAKVQEIAEHYEPALVFNTSPGAIDGVPVANEDGIVLGGNGRTMATMLVYAGRGGVPSDTPRRYLAEQAHEFGLDPDLVKRFARPMLVRTLRAGDDPRGLAEWSRRLNTSLSQQLDPTRLAVSRARFVDDSALHELTISDDETLGAFLSSARSRRFIQALQRSGVIDGRAAAMYIGADGLLNEAGRDLVADLLVALLVPDADLIGALGRGPVGTLARAAPFLVLTRGLKGYDLGGPLKKAVRDRVTMRAQGFDQVTDYLRQKGLFSDARAASEGDPVAVGLLHVLVALEGSPVKFSRFARRYAQIARAPGSGQGSLLPSEELTPPQALRAAAKEAGFTIPP